MADEALYVPTDAFGVELASEQEVHWPLPPPGGGPAEPPETGGQAPVLFTLDALLDELGERIFVAGGDPVRLVSETSWDLPAAARFALDCAEHAVDDADRLMLPSGASLGSVLAAARRYLEDGTDEDGSLSLLQRVSRLAGARRLRKLGDELATVARTITVEDEQRDLDALDDGAFAAVATVRDAVLAAVETIRHMALPRLAESEEDKYSEDAAVGSDSPTPLWTPWGSFLLGGPHGTPPASVTAREAAERAREAAGSGGERAGGERAWQRERLAQALGTLS